MKKMIPAFTAIVLIIIIAGVALGSKLIERYSYSNEKQDLNEYFNSYNEKEVPIILQDRMVEEKAVLSDGIYYFDLATVHKYFNSRFYWDESENLLIYTTPDQIIRSTVGSTSYLADGSEQEAGYLISYTESVGSGKEDTILYIAADYVRQYTNFSYEPFTGPNRMQVYTEWKEQKVASVTKDTAVRFRGGVKSPILTEVTKGDELVVLEEMETWSEVKTRDGFIGYVENKRLSEISAKTPEAVADYQEPEYTSLTRDHKISLGWHVIGGVAGNDTLAEAAANTKGMNVISPTWFKLSDNEGNFTSYATKAYVDNAHALGMEVWGLIDDFSNEVDVYAILSSTAKRAVLIQGLVQAALDCGMDGINIDFETIGADSGPHFLQFLRELSIQCRASKLVLSVDSYVPYNFNNYFDREEMGLVVDYVIIMGYDEHWHGSGEPGSVASIGYIKDGLETMTASVPQQKVMNAIPFYSILWKTVGAEVTDDYVTMVNQKSLTDNLGMQTVWDEETCQNYAELESGGTFYQIWLEDEDSIQVKLNVMRTYNLGGVAAWRLGYENAAVWDLIAAYAEE